MNKYRVFGYIGQLTYDFSMGKIRAGGWYEHADTNRHLFDFDWNTGLPNYIEKFNNGNGTAAQNVLPPVAVANKKYEQDSKWNQYQMFAEFEFRPVEILSITPGVKYVHFNRSIDATVNQSSRVPLKTSATWTKVLPFLTANLAVRPNWTFYGQYAQGMYVPDLSSFQNGSTNLLTSLAALKPQTSTNYQVGTVWHGDKVALDVDAYLINVDNKIGNCTAAGCDAAVLVNIGSVRYKGFEGQVSFVPIKGLTLFANGSYNQARSTSTGAQVAKAPFTTAAAGIAYRSHGLRFSFTQKYTGPQYAAELSSTSNGVTTVLSTLAGERLFRIKPYSFGEFAISQEVGEHFRIGLKVSNVFNSRAVTSIANSSSGAPTATVSGVNYQTGYGQNDQFSFLPPRSFQVDVRLTF